MPSRCLMCIVVILTLATAHGLSVVPPQFAGPVDSFDEADFPGVIILHVHSDGDLHIHVHLLGSHFFSLGTPTGPVHLVTPITAPVPRTAALLPLLFNVGNEPLAGSLPFLGGLAFLTALLSGLLIVLGSDGPPAPPPDPPPQRRRSLLAV